jgi:hypothetical protein
MSTPPETFDRHIAGWNEHQTAAMRTVVFDTEVRFTHFIGRRDEAAL